MHTPQPYMHIHTKENLQTHTNQTFTEIYDVMAVVNALNLRMSQTICLIWKDGKLTSRDCFYVCTSMQIDPFLTQDIVSRCNNTAGIESCHKCSS